MPSPESARHLRVLDFPRLVAVRRESDRRAALLGKPDLTYLFWEATLRCNLRCAHCGSSCEAQTPVRELTTEEVKSILDTIAEDFDPRRIFVSVTGGEPLTRADVPEVVAHMTKLGMRSGIVTNGTLLREKQAEALHEAGMRTASISIDGMEAEHEAIRGPGTWRRALRGITVARQAGFKVVEAITCVRPANMKSLDQIERAVRDAGADRWRLITIDKMGRGGLDAALWLEPPAIRDLFEHVERRRAHLKAARDRFDVRFSCGGFLGVHKELAVRPPMGQCFAGLCVASILCDGQVSACPSLPRSWAQGSALTERFSTIWKREFRPHRELAWRKQGVCADCSWWDSCLGGGLHERLAQPEEFCWLDRQDGG